MMPLFHFSAICFFMAAIVIFVAALVRVLTDDNAESASAPDEIESVHILPMQPKAMPVSAPMRGELGERGIATRLSSLGGRYSILNDVLIRIGSKSTQIDHVVLSEYGIFVIETKNYRGRITGNDCDDMWIQEFDNSKFERYSPVKQNYAHVKLLQYFFRSMPQSVFIPITVFPDECVLAISTESVCTRESELVNVVRSFNVRILSPREVKYALSRLERLRLREAKEAQAHTDAVAKKAKKKHPENRVHGTR